MPRYVAENFPEEEFLANVHEGDLLLLTIDDDMICELRDTERWYLERGKTDEAIQGNRTVGMVVGGFFVLVSLGGAVTMFKMKRIKPRRKRK